MNWHRVRNVLMKEWQVLATEPTTVMLILVVPFLVLGEALAAIFLVANLGGAALVSNPFFEQAVSKFTRVLTSAAGLSDIDQIRLYLLWQLNFFTLLIPTMITIYSASFSIVEEKVSRSLEPLLATPVRTSELLLGKALAGGIPALVLSWVCLGTAVLAVGLLGWGHLLPYWVGPVWFLNLFLLAPAVAMLSFLLGVIGSSKAKDFRSAQNLVFFIIFPVFLLIAVQVAGIVWFNITGMIALTVALFVIDLLVLRVAVRLFRRESIIIDWK